MVKQFRHIVDRRICIGIVGMLIALGSAAMGWGQAATTAPAAAPATMPAIPAASAKAIAEAKAATASALARAKQVAANLAAVHEILSIGLENAEAGELLREARRQAPDADELAVRVVQREREVASARLDRVKLLEELREATDPAQIDQLKAQLAGQDAYLAALINALEAERNLASQSRVLVTLLDSRLLWIGSAPMIGPAWVTDVVRGARWIADPGSWIGVGDTLLGQLWQYALPVAFAALLVGGLLVMRRRIKARLPMLAQQVHAVAADGFLLTIRALLWTILLALMVPLALAGVGFLLVSQKSDLFAHTVGRGFLSAAAVCALLDFFREMCQASGLADAHFGWPILARQTLQRNLRWLIIVEVPAAFVVATCDAGGNPVHRQGLGRLAFFVGSIGLSVFAAKVFRPSSGVFSGLMKRDRWAWRLRKLWYTLIAGLPAMLTLAAAGGYYYTATAVLSRFFHTGAIVLAGIVVYSMATRWLAVTRRHLAMKQAKQKRSEQRQAEERSSSASPQAAGEKGAANNKEAHADAHSAKHAKPAQAGEARPTLDLQAVDIGQASKQTHTFLRTVVAIGVLAALWALWSSLLPALTVLNRVQLTSPTFDTHGIIIVAPVTLWSLLMGIITVALTIIAARSLPALLELAVLQHFPLDAGFRYAASTLTRYIVVAIGIVVTSNQLGVEWSRAQWIIAALGVGLGFGLQEIVANFVSGLIILFERPVRVGDTVTVGNISGTVSRIQIRATTITDWDNKEVLVPNKSFITDQVVNWTLSNPVTRVIVPVGIAYGSDIAKAYRAIADSMNGIKTILSDPAPIVLFTGFGDSSLNFEVRVFVGSLNDRLPTQHQLLLNMESALRQANIEIPFPQRDLHLRTSDIDLSGLGKPRNPEPGKEPAKNED